MFLTIRHSVTNGGGYFTKIPTSEINVLRMPTPEIDVGEKWAFLIDVFDISPYYFLCYMSLTLSVARLFVHATCSTNSKVVGEIAISTKKVGILISPTKKVGITISPTKK